METISITSEDGTVYEYEKPEFECELFYRNKQYGTLHGIVFSEGSSYSIEWNAAGQVLNTTLSRGAISYDLTPIKKEWYETCSFPCLVIHPETNELAIAISYDGSSSLSDNDGVSHLPLELGWRPATAEEAMSLVVEQ